MGKKAEGKGFEMQKNNKIESESFAISDKKMPMIGEFHNLTQSALVN